MTPPLAAAVGSAVASWAASLTIGKIITSLATSLVLSGLQRLMTPKPKFKGGGGGGGLQSAGITQQIRQPIIIRRPVYGELRRSGGILFIGMTGGNEYIHMVLEVAPHEIAEIGEIWLNDYSIPSDWIDTNGNVTQGRYKDLIRIRKYLGSENQTADSLLVSEVSEWTTAHRLRGIAYIYIRMKWDQDKFPTSVPNVSAWVRGKRVYDPRTSGTVYNDNIALMLNDYLEWGDFGLGANSAEIDQTFYTAAANACDEYVTTSNYDVAVSNVETDNNSPIGYTGRLILNQEKLYFQRGDRVRLVTTGTLPAGLATGTDYYVIPYQRKDSVRIMLATSRSNALNNTAVSITGAGSGVHTVRKIAEPRYTGALVVDTELERSEIIKDLLSGMAGTLSYSGGVYRMLAGVYQTPTVYFNEGNMISPVSVQTKVSRRERFNTVRGVYISPINSGEPSDYPQVKNNTYISQDLEEIARQIDMPVTTRPHTAQRIAKINLELSRQEITWSADFDLSALQVVAGDNAYFSFPRFGWTNKIFQIKSWKLSAREDGETVTPYVRMELREIAAANYDWNNGEETTVDPSPNSNLPDIFTVQAVTGLGVSSEFVETQQGDLTFKVLLRWDLSSDAFVLNGGSYEIQYKRSNADEWRPTYVLPGNFNFAEVTLAAELNEDYDIRIRAVNSLGVRSGYTSIFGYLVGTSGGVGTTNDWGDFSSSPVFTQDWGDFSSSPVTTDDWGFFT